MLHCWGCPAVEPDNFLPTSCSGPMMIACLSKLKLHISDDRKFVNTLLEQKYTDILQGKKSGIVDVEEDMITKKISDHHSPSQADIHSAWREILQRFKTISKALPTTSLLSDKYNLSLCNPLQNSKLSFHLSLDLISYLFPSGVLLKFWTHFVFPLCVGTCPAPLLLLDVTILF